MGHIDNAFIRVSINSLEVLTPDVGTKPRPHAPKFLLRRTSYLAKSFNTFRSNSSKWEYTYPFAEHISHLVSSYRSSVTYVCVSVESAFVGTTKSTLELHNALYNNARNILHVHTFLQMSCSKPRLFNIGTRECGRVSYLFYSYFLFIYLYFIISLRIPSGCIHNCSECLHPLVTPWLRANTKTHYFES